jgi:hypothetical protein
MSVKTDLGWEEAILVFGPFLSAKINLEIIYIFPFSPLSKYLAQNGPLTINKLLWCP